MKTPTALIESFWKEPQHISNEVYRELLKNPPKHYCADLANCVDNPKDCRNEQCFECMAIVGQTRIDRETLKK